MEAELAARSRDRTGFRLIWADAVSKFREAGDLPIRSIWPSPVAFS